MAHPLLSKKRKSGIPTGNAGEYFVMGELLRRGFDAQLADRNTKGYDLLVGQPGDPTPKIASGRIRAMRQNQRIIRGDACDPPSAWDVCRQPVQVAAPA